MRISPPPPLTQPYEVVVRAGALADLPAIVSASAPAVHYVVLADDAVAAGPGARARDHLIAAGSRADLILVPSGEAHKTRETWARLTDELIRRGVSRDGCVVAVGGGVTCDIGGFVAATFMRGVPVVQVPTTLLAMVDASVGGKTGVDVPGGKNMVGAFHHPRAVIMDPEVLRTLPAAERRAGLAEAVKHGAIADAGYLDWIGDTADSLLAAESDAMVRLIRRSVEIKAEFVAADPYENGPRKALNLGHTVGHAIEALTGYRLIHGYAVAIGMVAETRLGEAAGVTAAGTAELLRDTLAALGLPTALPAQVSVRAILTQARRDKKVQGGRVHYALLARAGAVARTDSGGWTFPLEDDLVAATLASATGPVV